MAYKAIWYLNLCVIVCWQITVYYKYDVCLNFQAVQPLNNLQYPASSSKDKETASTA